MKIPGAYSQRDPRWASHLLGYNTDSAFNLGSYGCLVTAVANLAWYMGHPELTPDAVNNLLKQRSGFVDGGVMVWGAAQGLIPDLRSQGTTNDLAAVERFVEAEGAFAILQVTKPGFPMHFVVLPLVGQIIDSWDGQLKPVGAYTFITAHLYSDVSPDFVTTAQPATSPAPQPVNTGIQFTPLNQDVTITGATLDVHTGPGTNYPGSQANTADHKLHQGQVVHVTGITEGESVSVFGGHTSNKWLRSQLNHWFAAAGTNYDTSPAPAAAPELAPVPQPAPAPAPEPEPAPAPTPVEPTPEPAPVPTHDEVLVDQIEKTEEAEELNPPLVKTANQIVYVSDIESGKHVEKVPAGIAFTFIVRVNKNGIQYGVTHNMLNTDPVRGVNLDQFKPVANADITAPQSTHFADLATAVESEVATQGPLWRGAVNLLHKIHKEKK